MKKVGLVTVLYNSDNLLKDFFESISIQDHKNYTLYLIDNSPKESTRAIIKSVDKKNELTEIKHYECHTNLGVAQANNIGINLAISDGCEYIILMNNDICFGNSNLFSSILATAEEKSLHLIAPKVYYYGTKKIWYAGGEILTWNAGARHFHDRKEDKGQADKSCFTGYAPTTFMLIKAEVFTTVKTLDTKYFIYAEDLDFVYRATKAGYKIWYEADLFLYHKVSSTTGGILSDIGFYYNTRNRVYFARKFFPLLKRTVAIFYVFASLLYHSLKQKRASAVRSFLKGFFNGFKMPVF